jgi:hypothetical protein
MIGIGCCVHTGWGETSKDNFEFCAINTAVRAKVACSRSARRITGAALRLRNSAQWNFWKAHGAPHRTIPASCIADADIDAEDYPERDPQKGH